MVRADAAVISTDSLIYGGLVDSRKHNESLTVLMGRENKIKSLHSQYPKTPIYAFGTIMRTPYASGSGVEPYYYSKYGNDLYRLSGLQDKMDAGKLSTDEAAELLSLKLSIPSGSQISGGRCEKPSAHPVWLLPRRRPAGPSPDCPLP